MAGWAVWLGAIALIAALVMSIVAVVGVARLFNNGASRGRRGRLGPTGSKGATGAQGATGPAAGGDATGAGLQTLYPQGMMLLAPGVVVPTGGADVIVPFGVALSTNNSWTADGGANTGWSPPVDGTYNVSYVISASVQSPTGQWNVLVGPAVNGTYPGQGLAFWRETGHIVPQDTIITLAGSCVMDLLTTDVLSFIGRNTTPDTTVNFSSSLASNWSASLAAPL